MCAVAWRRAGILVESLAHAGGQCVQGDYDVIKTGECNNYRAHKEMKQREELATLQAHFTARREELSALVDKHNLRQADPLGETAWPGCTSLPVACHAQRL